jgi:hypothetical protein
MGFSCDWKRVVQAKRLHIDGYKEAALGVVRTLSLNIVLITGPDGSGRRL